jgi:hypothetical protein
MDDRRHFHEDLLTEKEIEASAQHDIAILREHWAEQGYGPDDGDSDDFGLKKPCVQNANDPKNARSSLATDQ